MRIGYVMQKGVDIRRRPFDGPANHVRHVVEELAALGHAVRVVVALADGIWSTDDLEHFAPVEMSAYDASAARLAERGVRRIQAALRLPYAAWFDSRRFAAACCTALGNVDLLFERRNWMCFGGLMAARRLSAPLVLEDNGDSLLDLEAKGAAPHGLQRSLSVALTRRHLRGADHIVASGDGWRDRLVQVWGVAPQRVTTVENGTLLVELLARASLASFQPDPQPGPQPGPTSVRPLTLAYVGGFYPWHGVPAILRGMARGRSAGLPLRGLFVGAGAGFAEAQALAADLGLGDAATFTGQLAPGAYAPLLAAADCGLSPYCNWPEFSGLKVLDYKAAGLAIIASGEGGRPATLRHGETGWIVPPCDEDALYDAVVRLAQDRELRRRLGQAARLEAERCHTWHHTVARLDTIFRTVAAGPAARAA